MRWKHHIRFDVLVSVQCTHWTYTVQCVSARKRSSEALIMVKVVEDCTKTEAFVPTLTQSLDIDPRYSNHASRVRQFTPLWGSLVRQNKVCVWKRCLHQFTPSYISSEYITWYPGAFPCFYEFLTKLEAKCRFHKPHICQFWYTSTLYTGTPKSE